MIGSELPKGWNKVKLLDIADLSTGKVDANHSTEDGLYGPRGIVRGGRMPLPNQRT